jgi:hypothetical protein
VTGPYDLGNIVVRAALDIDRTTAQVTAVSDPLPRILEGVPLRLRSIQVSLDRPGFTLNPTNCDPFSVEGAISGDEGALARPSPGFQAGNCAVLPFGPKLGLRLTGGLKRLGHPAVHATLTPGRGEANLKRISVALPKGELLDNAHIGTVCTRPDFLADSCPAGSLVGTAEATTPLLGDPLRGGVYLRANPAHKLPDLAIDLEGQFEIEVAAKIDTVNGGSLRTTFEAVPDAPITQFKLDLLGGSRGLLQNSGSLCVKKPRRARVTMTGQNGVVRDGKVKLQAACGGSQRVKRGRR